MINCISNYYFSFQICSDEKSSDELDFTLDAEKKNCDEDEGVFTNAYHPEEKLASRSNRVRTLSENNACATKFKLGRTSSWPRGILKHRVRSLSESNLGVSSGWSSLGSSVDLEDVLEHEELDEDDSIITDDGVSSSFKKSVRFNDVVKQQVFKANASILGQRAKNQKKAAKKKKGLERRNSKSDSESIKSNDSTKTTTEEDSTETDLHDNEDATENITSQLNDNSTDSNSIEYSTSGKSKKNKKKNKKNKKNVELSNNMIFQLDLDS